MICGKCRSEIRDGLVFCPNCGQKVEGPDKKREGAEKSGGGGPSWKLFIFVLALIGIIGGGYYYYTFYYKAGKMSDAGFKAQKHGDWNACIESLTYVVEKQPKTSTDARLALSDCYIHAGKPDEAVKQMEDAASWDAKNQQILTQWAVALYKSGEACSPPAPACTDSKYQGAADKAGMALMLDGKIQKARQILGEAQLKRKDYVSAEKNLSTALTGAAPDDAIEVNNALGEARLAQDETDAAIGAFEDSIKVYANQPQILMKLANLYSTKKNWLQCTSNAKRAFEIFAQTNDQDDAGKADTLAKTCEDVVKVIGIKDCIISRRGVDEEYIALDNDLRTFLKELQATPANYMGQQNTRLDQLIENDKGIKDSYSKLTCSTDYENRFKSGLFTFTSQLEVLDKAMRSLRNYVQTRSDSDRVDFEMQNKRYSEKLKNLIDIWKDEEQKFGLKPIIQGGSEPSKESPDKGSPKDTNLALPSATL